MKCDAKMAYATIMAAQRACCGRRRSGVQYLRVYACPECGMFHLTSKKPKIGNTVKEAAR